MSLETNDTINHNYNEEHLKAHQEFTYKLNSYAFESIDPTLKVEIAYEELENIKKPEIVDLEPGYKTLDLRIVEHNQLDKTLENLYSDLNIIYKQIKNTTGYKPQFIHYITRNIDPENKMYGQWNNINAELIKRWKEISKEYINLTNTINKSEEEINKITTKINSIYLVDLVRDPETPPSIFENIDIELKIPESSIKELGKKTKPPPKPVPKKLIPKPGVPKASKPEPTPEPSKKEPSEPKPGVPKAPKPKTTPEPTKKEPSEPIPEVSKKKPPLLPRKFKQPPKNIFG